MNIKNIAIASLVGIIALSLGFTLFNSSQSNDNSSTETILEADKTASDTESEASVEEAENTKDQDQNHSHDNGEEHSHTGEIDLASFNPMSLAEDAEIVDCTLTDGTDTECAQIVVKYLPDDLEIGPFCPDNIYEDEGGVWDWGGDNPGAYRLNEEFYLMLQEQGFEFFDENGDSYIGDPAGQLIDGVNNCLEATLADAVEMTATIPLNPVKADTVAQLGTVAQVGIAINGTPIFADAPSVLDRGHMPALDTCGGHVDPGGWYHWHAVTNDIESSYNNNDVDAECYLDQDSSALFGFAFDGFAIYGSAEPDSSTPADLDECNGHVGPTSQGSEEVYHYHASLEFPNLPECLAGVAAQGAFSTTASNGVGAGGGGGPGGPGAGGPPR